MTHKNVGKKAQDKFTGPIIKGSNLYKLMNLIASRLSQRNLNENIFSTAAQSVTIPADCGPRADEKVDATFMTVEELAEIRAPFKERCRSETL